MTRITAVALAVLCLAARAVARDGAGRVSNVPVRGWSSWNTFGFNINETLVRGSIDAMAANGLLAAGYNYVLIDDGWPECLERAPGGGCAKNPPRTASGEIPVNTKLFPSGMKALADYAHAKGAKLGIYTSVSAQTCGGFIGSLGHEETDAATFASWGMDFIKHDTCGIDCAIHDGCMQNATHYMRKGIDASGRAMVYYIDSGNPTSGMRVYNPRNLHVTDQEMLRKVAVRPSELAWVWGNNTADMIKSWFDIDDTWLSTLSNMHNQVRVGYYQRCGFLNMPGMLTVGQGHQTMGQYRAQFFTWAVLGAPLIMGADVRDATNETLALVMSPEVVEVDEDPDCLQGSLVQALGATEIWAKTLHDGTWAIVFVNKGDAEARVVFHISNGLEGWGMLYPACAGPPTCTLKFRNLYTRTDVPGTFSEQFVAVVPALDAQIYKATVVKQEN